MINPCRVSQTSTATPHMLKRLEYHYVDIWCWLTVHCTHWTVVTVTFFKNIVLIALAYCVPRSSSCTRQRLLLNCALIFWICCFDFLSHLNIVILGGGGKLNPAHSLPRCICVQGALLLTLQYWTLEVCHTSVIFFHWICRWCYFGFSHLKCLSHFSTFHCQS